MSIFSPAILPLDGHFGAQRLESGMDDTTDRHPVPHDDILMVRPSGDFDDDGEGEFLASFRLPTQDGRQGVLGQIARFNGRFQSAKWVLNLQAESDVFRVFVPPRNMVCANRTTIAVFEQRFSSVEDTGGYAIRLIDLEDGSTIWRVIMDINPNKGGYFWRPRSDWVGIPTDTFLPEVQGVLFESGHLSTFGVFIPDYPGFDLLYDSLALSVGRDNDSWYFGPNAHISRSLYVPYELIHSLEIDALSQAERDARDLGEFPSVLLTDIGRPLVQVSESLAYYDGTANSTNNRFDITTGQSRISGPNGRPQILDTFAQSSLPGNSIITIDSDRNVESYPLDPGVRLGNLSRGFVYRAGSSYVIDWDPVTFDSYLRIYSGWPTAANFVSERQVPFSTREIPGSQFNDADVFRRRFFGGAVVSPDGNYVGGAERRDDMVWTLDPP